MDLETKKDLTSNWFKTLQNSICYSISNLEKNKIINDELYSDSKARVLLRRGYSINKINQSLANKGIERNLIKEKVIFDPSWLK